MSLNLINSFIKFPASTCSCTMCDDFTSYATQGAADAVWSPLNTASQVNITTDLIPCLSDSTNDDGQNNNNTRDLTSVSDTAWTLDIHIKVNSITNYSSGNIPIVWWGIFDKDKSSASTVAQDGISLFFIVQGSPLWNIYMESNNVQALLSGTLQKIGTNILAVDDWFWRLQRTSATQARARRYTDRTFTTLASPDYDTLLTVNSATVGLRYIGCKNYNQPINTSAAVDTDCIEVICFDDGVVA